MRGYLVDTWKILTKEPEDVMLVDAIYAHKDRLHSAVAHRGAAAAVARKQEIGAAEADAEIAGFAKTFAIRSLPIGSKTKAAALLYKGDDVSKTDLA